MSLVTNTNIHSLQAQRRLNINSTTLQNTMTRLSSGFRINKSADDAAGQFISQNNDTYGTSSRQAINAEIQSLLADIDRIATASNFNGTPLLDGSVTTAPLQIGPNSTAATNVLDIASVLPNATAAGLGVVGPIPLTFPNIAAVDLATPALARSFMTDLDAALRAVNLHRANIGSMENRLTAASENLNLSVENFSAANSRIRDLDIAAESSKATQYQILTQAAASVLSQTNQLPQMILSLLQK